MSIAIVAFVLGFMLGAGAGICYSALARWERESREAREREQWRATLWRARSVRTRREREPYAKGVSR